MSTLPNWASLYLQRLQLDRKSPSLSYLSQLCRAHLQIFPYENVSKLLFFRDGKHVAPTPEEYVHNATHYHFGGTCYTNNHSFLALLRTLGFFGHLILPGGGHTAILIDGPNTGDTPVYVDTGATAPIFEPIHFLEEGNHTRHFGTVSMELTKSPDHPEHYRFTRYENGKVAIPPWDFHPNERKELSDLSEVIRSSFLPDAFFLNRLHIHRFQLEQDRFVALKNNTLHIGYSDGTDQITPLHTVSDIKAAVADEMQLPLLPVREAIEILLERGIDIFAAPKKEEAPLENEALDRPTIC
ncbi:MULTISPECIES: arylamine N-acetyltransferase [Brevibacillus]|uniref:Arylamine N-acetyltransferase n=1 Tax=Brevibacillus brevis TaxID=1393 RepID=A0A2Z4MQF0_BREBE|nr:MULTISPECIES: arylamine N-acetyltransferase [Brevibacillus]AWX58738.1 arylamine N-acetyltransferase [Brevibacillus brevis]NRR19374.1 arylamine N-acetyltransferase [Brevibacillus sp. MS2.2]